MISHFEKKIAEICNQTEPDQELVQSFYVELLASQLWLPVDSTVSFEANQKRLLDDDDLNAIRPLYMRQDNIPFAVVFDTQLGFDQWIAGHETDIGCLVLSGRDLIANLHPDVHFILNPQSSWAKHFEPAEIEFLKKAADRSAALASRWEKNRT